jgi:endonuclease/exonuclease/phosphatase family metal-dependent hydrolase
MKYILFLFLIISLTGNTQTKPSTTLVTWNIQNLGRTKNANEIHSIAKIIKDYDIVAIQEVTAKDPKGAQAVAKIADDLNRMGSKWDYKISDPTKSPSANISERYAYIWKTSKVSLVGTPYLDTALSSKIDREPYIAEFKTKKDGNSFYVINFHAKTHNHAPETEIDYFKMYPTRLKSENVFILGDFNLNEKHSVWENLYARGYKSALNNTPTTLKKSCKNNTYFNHSIDNIFYNSKTIYFIKANQIDFVKKCKHLEASRLISDHLPVFLEFRFK